MTIVAIENNTGANIYLPNTDSFPRGITLVVGLNRVPQLYMDELTANRVMTEGRPGKKPVERFPGVEALDDLQKPVRIVTTEGVTFGPRITIYTDPSAVDGRPDGPPMPPTLDSYNERAGLALVQMCTDRKTLENWTRTRNPNVANAARMKLGASV